MEAGKYFTAIQRTKAPQLLWKLNRAFMEVLKPMKGANFHDDLHGS